MWDGCSCGDVLGGVLTFVQGKDGAGHGETTRQKDTG